MSTVDRDYKGDAKKTIPSELVIPYILEFRRRHTNALIGTDSNERRSAREEHLVGKAMARRFRDILSGRQKRVGFYKVDEILAAIGMTEMWMCDPALEAYYREVA